MNTLDWYIVRRLALCLGLAIVSLILISVVIDLTENIDTFIDFSAQPQQIALYYVPTALLDHTDPAHCRTAWIAFRLN